MQTQEHLSTKEIVRYLDRYIIGQNDAKKAIAIALRNRWRRKMLSLNSEYSSLIPEITPKNILMVGPTGVGKTEIARRTAKLSESPFIKVEATKFTEVGYVGRNVDSIICDLVEVAFTQIKNRIIENLRHKAEERAEKRIVETILGPNASQENKDAYLQSLRSGKLDNDSITVSINDNSQNIAHNNAFDMPGMQIGVFNIGDMLNKAIGHKKTKTVTLTIAEAKKHLVSDESENLVDDNEIAKMAIHTASEEGIVFIDEIDKIAGRGEGKSGSKDVSREGVQRDLLPLIEGTVVSTKYGQVKTDHILFIASGAFHFAKPSDLLPELQGRLPVRVSLNALSEEDMLKILTEPEHNLPRQYQALLSVENVKISFTDQALKEIARIATSINQTVENIGARRLHTVLEKIMEEVSFEAENMMGDSVNIDEEYVSKKLSPFIKNNDDLSKFIL